MEWFEIKINNTVFAYLLRTKWIHYMINLIILLVWPWLHGVQRLSWKPPGRILGIAFSEWMIFLTTVPFFWLLAAGI